MACRWVKLVHQLRGTGRTRRGMESSRRSRGLLFLAMGAAVASGLEHSSFNVYETGIGCINLCCAVGADLPRLASVTMSCDEGEGHKPNSMEHCGLCTSCIFRRLALLAAGQEADPTRYRDQPTRRHGGYELRAFEHHASELANCVEFDDLIALDQAVRFASRAPTEQEFTKDEMETRVFEMYSSYRQEISEFLGHAPILHARPKLIRKENNRGLFAAAG